MLRDGVLAAFADDGRFVDGPTAAGLLVGAVSRCTTWLVDEEVDTGLDTGRVAGREEADCSLGFSPCAKGVLVGVRPGVVPPEMAGVRGPK